MIDMKIINYIVVNYMNENGLYYENNNLGIYEDEIILYNFIAPQYEEEKESIQKLLDDFYKVLGYSVLIKIEQLEDNIGEKINIRLIK